MSASRTKSANASPFGICVKHNDGTIGWLTGNDARILSFATKEEAEREMKKRLKDKHYSWNCNVFVDKIPENLSR